MGHPQLRPAPGYFPGPPPPPRSSNNAALVVTFVLLGLGLLVFATSLANTVIDADEDSVTSSAPPTTSGPRTTTQRPSQPTAKPTPKQPTYQNDNYEAEPPPRNPPQLPYPANDAQAKTWLTRNSLYGQVSPKPVRCALSLVDAPTAKTAQLQRHADELTACLMRVWDGTLASAGYLAVRPNVTIYTQPIQTPCGRFEMYNAYYCPANQRVYYAPNVAEWFPPRATSSRLTVLLVIAHEFGHVVQARTGIWQAQYQLARRLTRNEALAYSRRAELQADCLSGVFVGSLATALAIDQNKRNAIAAHAKAWGDEAGKRDPNTPGDHGSGANRANWVLTGVDHRGSLAACNTWVAPDQQVR